MSLVQAGSRNRFFIITHERTFDFRLGQENRGYVLRDMSDIPGMSANDIRFFRVLENEGGVLCVKACCRSLLLNNQADVS